MLMAAFAAAVLVPGAAPPGSDARRGAAANAHFLASLAQADASLAVVLLAMFASGAKRPYHFHQQYKVLPRMPLRYLALMGTWTNREYIKRLRHNRDAFEYVLSNVAPYFSNRNSSPHPPGNKPLPPAVFCAAACSCLPPATAIPPSVTPMASPPPAEPRRRRCDARNRRDAER